MKKQNIIKKNYDFNRIIKNNKPIIYKYFIIYIKYIDNETYRFGFSISKKIGKAVIRNKIKRQLKNIIDKKNFKNGFDCIIMVRKGILDKTFIEIQKDLHSVFNKLKILEGEKNE